MGIIKNITYLLVCGLLIVWSGVNVYRQVVTIMEAKVENRLLLQKIEVLENDIIKLKANLEYATSSASQARLNREVLGLGEKDDYWVVVKKGSSEVELQPKLNEVESETNVKRWWKLFTK